MAGNVGSTDTPAVVAVAYGKIAKSLKKLGELSLALKVCDKGIERFPDNGNIHIVKGEVQVARYNADNTKTSYLKSALGSFEKALRLDPHNYLAKLLASQIYLKAGGRKQARALLSDVLKTSPGDEKASSLMALINQKEKASIARKAMPAQKEVVTAEPAVASQPLVVAEEPADPKELTSWSLDERVEVGNEETDDDEIVIEALSAKLSIFSRLEGLSGIFILDRNGQPVKIVNKARLDENVVPSLVFNLHKASVSGAKRFGMGDFKRGTLVCPVGTIITEELPQFGVLAVIVDNDANMATVDKRIHRYLAEVAL
ncbi:hypothetical protein MNBD_NITROSPINAE01-1081 [hydrothermal vent metagenome]|uniref:Uncharacterized protein n=1 Tax=hydrothermal vent metagenome TaxID=652676 RepID=A0A3B1BU33_9ZZZZ